MNVRERITMLLTLTILCVQAGALYAAPATVDLTKAVLVTAGSTADLIERQAAAMLGWEIRKRTGIQAWGLGASGEAATSVPAGNVPAVIVGSLERMPAIPAGISLPEPPMKDGKLAPEGYVLAVDTKSRLAPTVCAIGNDHRGALYAVGRLLRSMDWGPNKVRAPADLSISTAPAYPIRGVQLGYRDASDTYDAWDVEDFTQYFRDLLVFGANSVEITPTLYPGAPEAATPGAVMSASPWDITVALTAVLDAYDMDVWFWLPLGDVQAVNAANPEDREKTLQERDSLFAACRRIDHVFVPGGDPGNTPPQILMPYLEELARVLRKHHPEAGLWVSTQGFEPLNLDYFYEYLQKEQPDWLTGVVYGPWAKDTLEHTRAAVPAKYPIRHYPDITHSVRSQYPIPYWDPCLAQTYERQPIMPRPTQTARVCNRLSRYTAGSIGYSDGTGDDVNKMIWNAMLWDPKADVREVLRDFGRYFVSPDCAEGVAEGLLMIEKNWIGPTISNPQIPKTLAHYQALEKRAGPAAMASWRLQQQLVRAYGDAYLQKRVQIETRALDQAFEQLRQATKLGPDQAMARAEKILEPVLSNPRAAAPAWRNRLDQLAADLHNSIGMQLSIEKFGANRTDRGALLDTIDRPVTDALWVRNRIASEPPKPQGPADPTAPPISRIPTLKTREAKLAAIDAIVNWTNPGPGGFYDDLGNTANGKEPHLVLEPGWEADPGFVVSAQDEQNRNDHPLVPRLCWLSQAQTLYWTPLRMRYAGLDPKSTYVFKANCMGRFAPTMQLYFDEQKVGEPIRAGRDEPVVVEFEVPASAVADGVLDVKFEAIAGRGAQVAEAWLVKKK